MQSDALIDQQDDALFLVVEPYAEIMMMHRSSAQQQNPDKS